MTTPTLPQRIERFDVYFRSANGVPPNARISVPTAEWQELRAALTGPAAGAATAAVPEFNHVATNKLRSLIDRGYTVTGYALEKPLAGAQPDRGFIDHGGFVGWWRDDHAATPTEPSPTAGMNIAQRILHVGGRNNAAGYVEFGSIQAVRALVLQVLRDLPELPALVRSELESMPTQCLHQIAEPAEYPELPESCYTGCGPSFREYFDADTMRAYVDADRTQRAAVQQAEPVAGQSRFKGREWTNCSSEHVTMVLAAPDEWKNYEVRYLYAEPAPSHPAEGVPAGVAKPVPITFMTEDHACAFAWKKIREDLGTKGWTTGDSCNFHGFYMWGWRYRAQYELQCAATRSAVIQEFLSAAPAAPAADAAGGSSVSNAETTQAQDVQRDADIQHAVLAERERICAAIKAEDDHCVTQGDYMLDSEDCIRVARGKWVRPVYEGPSAARAAQGGA